MFSSNYYCLVAGLREYSLDSDTKGFDAGAVISEISDALTSSDLRQLHLLYGYYDCENIISLKSGRATHNPLGILSREELEEELLRPSRLPEPLQRIVRLYADPESEEAEGYDFSAGFDHDLMAAYYEVCRTNGCRFMREWAAFDRNMRNIAAATAARATGRQVKDVVVGSGHVVEQILRSSVADFGLRGEVDYVDAVLAAMGDEANIMDKEHKMDLLRWSQVQEMTVYDYFDINAILGYLVRLNIVARWSRLDAVRGREMFDRLMADLDATELVNGK